LPPRLGFLSIARFAGEARGVGAGRLLSRSVNRWGRRVWNRPRPPSFVRGYLLDLPRSPCRRCRRIWDRPRVGLHQRARNWGALPLLSALHGRSRHLHAHGRRGCLPRVVGRRNHPGECCPPILIITMITWIRTRRLSIKNRCNHPGGCLRPSKSGARTIFV